MKCIPKLLKRFWNSWIERRRYAHGL